MAEYEAKTVKVIFKPVGEPIFCEGAIAIEIEDEAAGEYVSIKDAGGDGSVAIDPSWWPELRAAIDSMVARCQG